jgi:lipopolysaccharide heptosyltransferase II
MRPPSRQPHNILIIHTHGGMGDLLLSSVLAEALHRCYPGCRVTFWAQSRFAPLLDHHPFVDARFDLDPAAPLRENARILRTEHFDTVLIPWSVSRHAWLTWLAGIPVRVGQGGRLTYSFLFTHPVKVRSRRGDVTSHWTDSQLDYARIIGCEAPPDLKPVVITTPAEKETAAARLSELGCNADRPICGLHICKGLAVDAARWPLDRFVDIAAGLLQQGFDVLLTGTANEHSLTSQVAARAHDLLPADTGAHLIDLAGACTLRETAALIERMNVFICPDTGTGHLAAALGVPVVSIFPVRSDIPARWRPAIDPHRVIRPVRYECSGSCVKEKCPCFTCLLHIDPDEVVTAAREIAKT